MTIKKKLIRIGIAFLVGTLGALYSRDDSTTKREPQVERRPTQQQEIAQRTESPTPIQTLSEEGEYTSKEEVALYLHTYGYLPQNFITKAEAHALGWNGGLLETYAPGKSIGGDHFGNFERRLPKGSYQECDIDTLRRPRGTKRLIYSTNQRIYYSPDHYESFEQLY